MLTREAERVEDGDLYDDKTPKAFCSTRVRAIRSCEMSESIVIHLRLSLRQNFRQNYRQ